MAEKQRFPLAQATELAGDLVYQLAEACEEIHIAGSVRRATSDQVGDIELVVVPKAFDPDVLELGHSDHLDRALQSMIQAGTMSIRGGYGPTNKFLTHTATGVPIDVFATTRKYLGMTMMIRTGPKDYVVRFMRRLIDLGLRGHASGGIDDRQGLEQPCPDEATVFAYLAWPVTDPSDRR